MQQARVKQPLCSCILLRRGTNFTEEGSRLNQIQDTLQAGHLDWAEQRVTMVKTLSDQQKKPHLRGQKA